MDVEGQQHPARSHFLVANTDRTLREGAREGAILHEASFCIVPPGAARAACTWICPIFVMFKPCRPEHQLRFSCTCVAARQHEHYLMVQVSRVEAEAQIRLACQKVVPFVWRVTL